MSLGDVTAIDVIFIFAQLQKEEIVGCALGVFHIIYLQFSL